MPGGRISSRPRCQLPAEVVLEWQALASQEVSSAPDCTTKYLSLIAWKVTAPCCAARLCSTLWVHQPVDGFSMRTGKRVFIRALLMRSEHLNSISLVTITWCLPEVKLISKWVLIPDLVRPQGRDKNRIGGRGDRGGGPGERTGVDGLVSRPEESCLGGIRRPQGGCSDHPRGRDGEAFAQAQTGLSLASAGSRLSGAAALRLRGSPVLCERWTKEHGRTPSWVPLPRPSLYSCFYFLFFIYRHFYLSLNLI